MPGESGLLGIFVLQSVGLMPAKPASSQTIIWRPTARPLVIVGGRGVSAVRVQWLYAPLERECTLSIMGKLIEGVYDTTAPTFPRQWCNRV